MNDGSFVFLLLSRFYSLAGELNSIHTVWEGLPAYINVER